jgi:hypothetical protein
MSSKEEERRKIILQNFVEKSGFSPSIRPKIAKIAKSTIHLIIFNYYALRLIEKNEGRGKNSILETRN